ncbi:MAG TPA: DUF2304 domain-containing protein [Gaiellaceae bacterium]|nr:DUF2304 domain-containing protein [Gaiellaceae bacterium]
MTSMRASTVAALAAVLLIGVVLELIRSRRLQERYALLWLLTGGVILLLAIWRGLLGVVAEAIGIHYPPSALFAVAAVFFLIVLLHYSTVISKLAETNKTLAQRLALLETELEEHRVEHAPAQRVA